MRRRVGSRWILGACAALLAAASVGATRPAAAGELYATVERTAAPGERALVVVRASAPGPVTARAFRVEDPFALLDAGLDLRDGAALQVRLAAALDAARPPAEGPARDGGSPPRAEPQVAARLTFVTQARGTLGAPSGVPPADGTPSLPEGTLEVPLPASGLYLVEVARAGETTVVAALVSRLALVTKREPGGLLAFAADRTSGQALDGVRVVVSAAGRVLAEGTTDARGLWRHAGALPPTAEVRAARGDDLATGTEPYFPADVADRRVYAFAHQPAYRPGERLELKGIVRAWRDGAYALDASVAEVTVHVVAARATELGQVRAAVSPDLGTFAASFDLPASAPLGDATLVVDAGGKSYAAPFRIEAYRKPTFEVTAAPEPARVLAGGDVAWRVEAAWFEGGPLAGAPFSWTLTYHRVDRDLFPTDELARLFFGREREAFAPVPVAQGEGVLDAAGVARVATKAPTVPDDGFLTLRVTATAPDRTVAAGAGTAALAAAPLQVALRADKHLYGAEGVARVTVKAVRADGAPAAARSGVVTASLVAEAGAGGPREETVAGTWPVTTGDDGTATLDVPFARNGRYALSVALPRVAGEPEGPPATATVHVWVVGERADVGYSGDRVEVVTDKDTYAVGDRARVLVLAPVGARPFLSTVEGARLLAADTVRLGGADDRGTATVLEVTVGPEHVPNAYVGVAMVDRGHLLATEKLLRVPPVDRMLAPTVVPATAEAEPGASVPMTAKVADATGAPVAGAEVSVAVVDEALYALYADPAAPIAPFFHPVRRNDVRTGGPLHLASVGWRVTRAPAPAEAEGRDLADGGTGAPPPGAAPPPSAPMPAPEAAPADAAEPRLGGGRPVAGGLMPARGARRLEERARDDDGSPAKKSKSDDGGEGPLEARADFRSAVFWSPALRTGADGTVAVGPVRLGDSLTRWRVTAVAVDARTRVGTSTTTVRTAKKVLTRVTLPRFLRSTDVVRAPWVLRSLLREDADARYVATATGLVLRGPSQGQETLKAGAVVAHDLTLAAGAPGAAKVRAELRTPAGGDAVEHALPVLPQGVRKTLVASASAERGRVELAPLALPPSAERAGAQLRIVVTPSVAQAVGAALPYLADYPYGCTEQTMSRLVPVVVAKAAQDRFQVPLRGRLEALPKMLDAGLARLRALQHDDGGFGWWEKDASDPWMTAYVVHGLSRAAAVMAEPAPATAVLERAAAWLVAWLDATGKAGGEPGRAAGEAAVRRAFAVMALADAGRAPTVALPPDDGVVATPPLVRALLLRAAVATGADRGAWPAQVAALARRATRDAAGVRWEADRDEPGRFGADAVETTAWVAGAVLAADPRHEDLAGVVRWLLGQRADGERWRSTRDTAACVAFLTRYAAATGDLGAGRRVELSMNGLRLRPVAVTPESAFSDAAVVTLDADALPQGEVRVVAEADAPVSVAAVLSFTDTGPAVAAASAGFEVRRTWWLLTPGEADGKPVTRRQAVSESVPSGSVLDVEVTVTTDRARELVVVESPHAASFEPEKDLGTPVEGAGPAARADHRETRDDRTVFFVTSLPAGTHVFRHRVRAVHAGSFTALPASAALMYADDVRGNGAGEVLEVSLGGAAGAERGGGK